MEFGLNEDQEAFRATVRTFAREKLAPGYLERAKSDRFPWDAYREVAGLAAPAGRRRHLCRAWPDGTGMRF